MIGKGIVFFHELGQGWVLEKKLIAELFPEALRSTPSAHRIFLNLFEDLRMPERM